uniref:Agglutinin C-terminal domain-containing protein n=1 Tax=viral metagenome TaxID=1070528 RepID=A0A6M3LU41_9ZZZZ
MCLKTLFQSKNPEGAIHISSISGNELRAKIEAIGLQVPLGMLDSEYLYTDEPGWSNILPYLQYNPVKTENGRVIIADCEDYSFRAYSDVQFKYGINALGVALGKMPAGYHGFCIVYTGAGFKLFEPQLGFGIKRLFNIGEYGYQPDRVVI